MADEIAPRFEFTNQLVASPDDVLEQFLKTLKEKTKLGYISDLEQFRKWAGADSQAVALDALIRLGPGDANQLILSYKASMMEQKLKNPTINRRLCAIRKVLKYVRKIGLIIWSLDVEGEKVDPTDMSGPDLADTRLMFRAADQMGNGRRARRDRALLAITYDLNLRRNEVCAIDLDDVERDQDDKPSAVWILGKGRSAKVRLTMPEDTAQALSGWLQARGNAPGPLFQRCDGTKAGRLTGETIRLVVARIARVAGLKYKVRPHGLRHSATTDALEAGKSIQDVRKFGRWASFEMVMRYDGSRHDTHGDVARAVSKRRRDRGDKPQI